MQLPIKHNNLIFSTKEENNKRRQKAFLALSPIERLHAFLKMADEFQILPINKGMKHKNEKKDNFILVRNDSK